MRIKGVVGDVGTDADQLAQRGPLANDRGVCLDVGYRGSVLGQLGQVGQAADLRGQAFLVQLLVQGNHVKWLVGIGQLVHGTENQAVVMPVEIAIRHLVQHPLPGVVVQHQATEYGLFGLDGMRRHLQGCGLQV